MLRLPHVTLICLTGREKEIPQHEEALTKSSTGIQWGATKLIYDERIKSIDDWNKSIIFDLWRHVDTEYGLLIHPDGYVINPHKWRWEFMDYDYIGAPWPLPRDSYSYRTPSGELIRVGNSVSLRSRRIMELPTQLNLEWRSYYGNTNEDGYLCVHQREILKENGIKFAPLELAIHFSKEAPLPENEGLDTFAFHHYDG